MSPAVNAPATAPSASPPPSQPAQSSSFDIRSFSLFPSTLSDSPHHHSPSHSIVTLSEGAPRDVPPSPFLSESPTLAPQSHAHLGLDHILNDERLIVNVWASNLQEELAKIAAIVDDYPYIAMDTEFPGVVARPTAFKTSADYAYQTLKCNVDILKIIQLGLCFCDAKGNIHPGTCTWQVRDTTQRGSRGKDSRGSVLTVFSLAWVCCCSLCLSLLAPSNSSVAVVASLLRAPISVASIAALCCCCFLFV